MKSSPGILIVFLFITSLSLMLPAQRAAAQDNPDNQPHIQPHVTPTPPANAAPPQTQPERPPFPGDETPGESSSKDSQIDLGAHPTMSEPPRADADDAVLRPYDPHRAAKDVEVGNYYLKLKNYRAALERFNDALFFKPKDAEATYGLALTQEKLDLLDRADENYRKYLQISPNGPAAKEAQEAIKRISPHLAVRTDTGKMEPSKQAAHDIDVGETYLSINKFEAAHERFEEALRLIPDNPLASFRMAQSLQGMQRLDEARLYYRKYLGLQPQGRFAADAKKAIAAINYTLGK